jgi:hypothetical protein
LRVAYCVHYRNNKTLAVPFWCLLHVARCIRLFAIQFPLCPNVAALGLLLLHERHPPVCMECLSRVCSVSRIPSNIQYNESSSPRRPSRLGPHVIRSVAFYARSAPQVRNLSRLTRPQTDLKGTWADEGRLHGQPARSLGCHVGDTLEADGKYNITNPLPRIDLVVWGHMSFVLLLFTLHLRRRYGSYRPAPSARAIQNASATNPTLRGAVVQRPGPEYPAREPLAGALQRSPAGPRN